LLSEEDADKKSEAKADENLRRDADLALLWPDLNSALEKVE
jgi:hypothetical protein